jgi:hypothetical protein
MAITDMVSKDSEDVASKAACIGRWQRRPIISTLLRFAIVLLPLGIAGMLGLMAGWAVSGNGLRAEIVRVMLAGVVSLVTFVAIERLARRLLPLATLLKLSLIFPDHAPSRFSVALRSSSVRKLQIWARSAQHDDGPAALAEKVVTLAAALNTHDRRTRGHSERSRATAEIIAVEMGLTDAEVNEVRWGAFLHDIGKILVPAALLNKPGKPTPREWETLKRHPADGGDLVEPLRGFLGSGVEAVREHHENYDGSGYPKGLAGTDIALAARIVSVADSFEVMTAVRTYKKPMTATEARRELERHTGSQFDPAVVRALLNISLGRLHWTLGLTAWMAELPFLTVVPRAAAQVGSFAAGPTVSMTTLSGIAAISLGSFVAPATLSAVPASSTPSSGSTAVAIQSGSPRQAVSAVSDPQRQAASRSGQLAAAGDETASSVPGSAASGISGTSSTVETPASPSADTASSKRPGESSPLSAGSGPASISATVPSPSTGPVVTPPAVTPPVVPAVPTVPATALPPATEVNGSTGNPHQPGATGNPHQPGATGNPHNG